MATAPKHPTECSFCRVATKDLCICHRVDEKGSIHTGALCRECVRTFLFDWAYTDPEFFEKTVEEARNWRPDKPEAGPGEVD